MAASAVARVAENDAEPYFKRMTPLEIDVMLQSAQVIFTSMIKGQRLAADGGDLDSWYARHLGPEWVRRNEAQREEVLRQMKEAGENTPEWMESLAHMGDIAWEMFEAGDAGERVRNIDSINRSEIMEQFKELLPKVRDSKFARWGAGDQLYGLRACIAVLRVFRSDPEVLQLCATCLKLTITDNDYNRDGLCLVSVPMPPAERQPSHADAGWSFLRAAAEAILLQAGGDGQAEKAASLIAECVAAASGAPAFRAQVALLREKLPEGASQDRKELQELLPKMLSKVNEVTKKKSDSALTEVQQLFKGVK